MARTDRGLLRSTNQDSLFAGDRLLVVADGMGGHVAGDTASRLVVDEFMPVNLTPPGPDLMHQLLEATRAGNGAIAEMVAAHPDLEGMGTTVTAMLFDGTRAAIAHVGDSRAYLYREGVLHQLTHDDTFVQSLVDDGRITEHQAHEHPQRNLLLRALTGLELDPMLVEREIRVGDRYMLCSDGLCGVVDAESIADALAHLDPEIAADTLIHLALLNGGPDNVTAIVADVLATGERSDSDAGPTAAVFDNDPSSTNPIARLTRELPRVPLPPIPEEPAAPADIIDEDTDDEDTDDTDPDYADDDGFDDGDALEGDTDDTDSGTGRGTRASVGPAASRDIAGTATGVNDADQNAGTPINVASGSHPSGRARSRDTPQTNKYDDDSDISARGATRPTGTPRTDTRAPERRTRPADRRAAARQHWYRRGAIIVAALVLVGVAITGATLWVRHQYFVSDQGNVVVVFRGVNGSLLGWGFSTFEETSCAGATDCTPMKVSDLQPATQNQVRAGIKATSLSDARTVVKRLSAQMLPRCPSPSTPVPPTPVPPTLTTTPTTTHDAIPTEAASASTAREIPRSSEPLRPADETASSATRKDLGAVSVEEKAVIPTESVTATPLAPATLIPGVTCRTV
ncbi:MAG: protein phosphatase 2C domain-containing protein [Nakamurella sp.]